MPGSSRPYVGFTESPPRTRPRLQPLRIEALNASLTCTMTPRPIKVHNTL